MKDMTTDELIKFTTKKPIHPPNLAAQTMYDSSPSKREKKDRSDMVKTMRREMKFDFHQRERALGLPEIPLERPYAGRSSIKAIVMDIKTNINRIQ